MDWDDIKGVLSTAFGIFVVLFSIVMGVGVGVGLLSLLFPCMFRACGG